MYDNILFDLDGTLTDPAEGIINSILHSLTYFPEITAPSREFLQKFIGPPLAGSYMKYFGMDADTADIAVEKYREYFRPTGIFENKLYDGIKELLENLKASGRKVVLATSKPEVFAIQILEHFGLMGYFDVVCGSILDGTRVKKSDVIAYVLEQNPEFTAENTIMVGDTEFDILGAGENGLRAIGVQYGYGSGVELAAAGAFMVVKTVGELSDILMRL
ncbi:MAG: HAD hydrolase-like protein [Clostridia bacterium]|nr:HAD hydrolase-like protein [Clostridia bacterium]